MKYYIIINHDQMSKFVIINSRGKVLAQFKTYEMCVLWSMDMTDKQFTIVRV